MQFASVRVQHRASISWQQAVARWYCRRDVVTVATQRVHWQQARRVSLWFAGYHDAVGTRMALRTRFQGRAWQAQTRAGEASEGCRAAQIRDISIKPTRV